MQQQQCYGSRRGTHPQQRREPHVHARRCGGACVIEQQHELHVERVQHHTITESARTMGGGGHVQTGACACVHCVYCMLACILV